MDHFRVRLRMSAEIRHTGVVKIEDPVPAGGVVPTLDGVADPAAAPSGSDVRTRDRVTQLLLVHGAATAAELGGELGLSPAAIRRHLDAMLDDGDVVARDAAVRGSRGRGRPAKVFLLTDVARVRAGTHTYDGLATAALRWIAAHGGPEAVARFAGDQVAALESRCGAALEDAGDEPLARAEALAAALTAEGYAASASAIASGGQLCQHHCPVAHVAAEFPQLCEAETAAISKLVGTHVQRLATIAHGDGICTTHIPDPRRRAPAVAPAGNANHTTVRTHS
jgi:predicted ArsR family transcriptional regulator